MNKKILLIEDDYYLVRLYHRVLVHAGYAVTLLEDGEKGWSTAQEISPDLILLDIIMPRVNGMDVLKKLKEEETTKNIPVIMLTNLEQDDLIDRALKLGVSGYWIKVVLPPQDLVSYVGEFFKNPTGFHGPKGEHDMIRPKTIIHPRHFYKQQKSSSQARE